MEGAIARLQPHPSSNKRGVKSTLRTVRDSVSPSEDLLLRTCTNVHRLGPVPLLGAILGLVIYPICSLFSQNSPGIVVNIVQIPWR